VVKKGHVLMAYIIDTNSFNVLENYYPKRFPSFWRNIDELIRTGRLFSVREVFNELDGTLPDEHFIQRWINDNAKIFRPISGNEGQYVADIFTVNHFRMMIGQRQQYKGTPVADPFVIAAARACGGCVVTEERIKPNAAKIPNVCEHFGVDWTNIEGLLEREDWSF
jgi:hypothetical protein